MGHEYSLLLLIPLLPLIGAMWNGLAGRRLPLKVVGWTASAMPITGFLIAIKAFFDLKVLHAEGGGDYLQQTLYMWISSGGLEVPLAYQFDELTAVMVLVVTGVGSLIHIYSIGYMHDDPAYGRYFAYLNLFTFAMLTLVMANNLILMFVGWEGVGVCSYLLIGFWFEDMEKAIAGKKAFLVNRIGDFGFLLGFFVLFWTLFEHGEPAVTFAGIEHQIQILAGATFLGMPVPAVVGVCLFVGATGKSAQIPLYVWLPDAMAGPTPVSALIHAATMVTAGVYMVARMGFMYSLPEAEVASTIVAGVGAFTALFAASIGLFQHDIKKVLAYSTVSQLGYMFIAVGIGAYSAGIFHLMTHAFFKALLFLGSGSVIMGMHHEQDIRKMGGLLKYMPITAWTFIIGWLAIIGLPGMSGFFSKDEILWAAFSGGHPVIWAFGFLGALLTAFYMTRLVVVTFFGKLRLSEHELHHLPAGKPVESPETMTVPLIVLAGLSIVGGWVGIPAALGGSNHFHHWLSAVFGGGGHGAEAAAHGAHGAEAAAHGAHGAAEAAGHGAVEAAHGAAHAAAEAAHGAAAHAHDPTEYILMALTVGAVAASVALAYYLYTKRLDSLSESSEKYLAGEGGGGGFVYRLINAKYYVDELYDYIVVKPLRYGSRDYLWPADKWIIDGAVNILADVVKAVAGILGFLQGGNVKRYMAAMAFGAVLILLLILVAFPALSTLGGS